MDNIELMSMDSFNRIIVTIGGVSKPKHFQIYPFRVSQTKRPKPTEHYKDMRNVSPAILMGSGLEIGLTVSRVAFHRERDHSIKLTVFLGCVERMDQDELAQCPNFTNEERRELYSILGSAFIHTKVQTLEFGDSKSIFELIFSGRRPRDNSTRYASFRGQPQEVHLAFMSDKGLAPEEIRALHSVVSVPK